MVIADLKKSTDRKMDKSVQAFKADLAKVRTGRAHTGILDHVMVDYYGSQMPINQVAKVTLLDARTIGVTPFAEKKGGGVETGGPGSVPRRRARPCACRCRRSPRSAGKS